MTGMTEMSDGQVLIVKHQDYRVPSIFGDINREQ